MLIARIYALSWILVVGAVGVLHVTDSFTYGTAMILGFVASILAGAGLLVVYPAMLTERFSSGRKA